MANELLTERGTLAPLQQPQRNGNPLLKSQDRRNLRRAFLARFVWLNGVLQGVGIEKQRSGHPADTLNPLRAAPMLLHRLIAVELPHLLQALVSFLRRFLHLLFTVNLLFSFGLRRTIGHADVARLECGVWARLGPGPGPGPGLGLRLRLGFLVGLRTGWAA